MAQQFAAYEEIVSEYVDDLYGENIRVEPRADGDLLKGVADPARPVLTIVAVVDYNPIVVRSRDPGRYGADTPDLSGEKLHVSIADSRLPYKLKAGDRIVALDRPGQPMFAVAIVEPDGLGRSVCKCKLGKASL